MIMTLKLLLMWFDSVWQQNQLYKYSHDILSERTVCALTLISFILPSSCYVLLSYIRYRLRCLTDRSFMGVKIPFLQSAIAISEFSFVPTLMSKVAWGVKSAKERETTTLAPWNTNTTNWNSVSITAASQHDLKRSQVFHTEQRDGCPPRQSRGRSEAGLVGSDGSYTH